MAAVTAGAYEQALAALRHEPRTWLVTGVAGFIGSNLLETLLQNDQRVVGLDSFVTGHRHNLDQVRALVTPAQWQRLRFIEGTERRRSCRESLVEFGRVTCEHFEEGRYAADHHKAVP